MIFLVIRSVNSDKKQFQLNSKKTIIIIIIINIIIRRINYDDINNIQIGSFMRPGR